MVSGKLLLGAIVLVALVYIVYRAADWYFDTLEAKTEQELERQRRREERTDAIWADDDPETIDDDFIDRQLRQQDDPQDRENR